VGDTRRGNLNCLDHIIHNGSSDLHILDVNAVLLALLLDEVREFFELLFVVVKLHKFMSDCRRAKK
jgi:hypothetical protein